MSGQLFSPKHGNGFSFDIQSETERINNQMNSLRGRLSCDDGEFKLERPGYGRLTGLAIDGIDASFSGRGRDSLDR